VVYVNKKRNPVDVAISGHEYESSYSDGSISLSQDLDYLQLNYCSGSHENRSHFYLKQKNVSNVFYQGE